MLNWNELKGNTHTIEAMIGRNRVAVATLLMHSVKVAIIRHTIITIAYWGMVWSGVICPPSHLDKPDSCMWRNSGIVCTGSPVYIYIYVLEKYTIQNKCFLVSLVNPRSNFYPDLIKWKQSTANVAITLLWWVTWHTLKKHTRKSYRLYIVGMPSFHLALYSYCWYQLWRLLLLCILPHCP